MDGREARQPLHYFIRSGPRGDPFNFAQQVVGERFAFQGCARLQLAMQRVRYVANLYHRRHVHSIIACRGHLKSRASSLGEAEDLQFPIVTN